MPRKKAFARRERGSRCSGLGRGFLRSSRCWRGGMWWAAPAQGELCGAAHRPLHQALCSPTQGQEKTFLAVQWKIPRKRLCPTSAGNPCHRGMSVLRAAPLLRCHQNHGGQLLTAVGAGVPSGSWQGGRLHLRRESVSFLPFLP